MLGLLRLARRPVFDFFVDEEDGRLAGTTLVTYSERAGHLSVVSVARPYRRRGIARALLARAHAETLRQRRRYSVLEVLDDNAPALALYAAAGYHLLQRGEVLQREPLPGDFAGPPRAVPGLREFRREDARELVPLADALAAPELREVAPATREMFLQLPLIAASTESRSAAWVLEHAGRTAGFLRATVGGITRTAHLSQPIVAEGLAAEGTKGLIETGLRWVHERGPVRVITALPAARADLRTAVADAGFTTAYRLQTLAFDLHR